MLDWNVGRTVLGGDQHRRNGSTQEAGDPKEPHRTGPELTTGDISDKGVIFPVVKNKWMMKLHGCDLL